jgi:predicted nucleic acid-binding protein
MNLVGARRRITTRRGAAFRVLSQIGQGAFDIALSVPLVLEYEDALLRTGLTNLTQRAVDDVLDYFCKVAHLQRIFFLWRPLLPDPKDDMVLELAVAARCQTIVTYNLGDFAEANKFGVQVLEPAPFLSSIGALK